MFQWAFYFIIISDCFHFLAFKNFRVKLSFFFLHQIISVWLRLFLYPEEQISDYTSQKYDQLFYAVFLKEDLKAWTSNITTSIAEHEAMAKWDKPGPSSMDPDRSERKEKSEGDADARSERSELMEGEERSEKERSEKAEGSEKLDTSEIADKLEGGAGGSSTSGRSK